MKILLLDIETAPNKAYVWGLFKQNVALNQLEASSYTLCWSARWLDQEDIQFASVRKPGEKRMLRRIHTLLDQADVVVHYNGLKFDIPTLNKEFVRCGMLPPAPYKQVDLMQVVKRALRFESNKLAFVLEALGLRPKVKHEGFGLWIKCMEGDARAWERMEVYNRGDVEGLGELYQRLLPWISKHPNLAAHRDTVCCPKCGSGRFQSRGVMLTTTLRYNRYQCQGCGGWFRDTTTVSPRVRRVVNA